MNYLTKIDKFVFVSEVPGQGWEQGSDLRPEVVTVGPPVAGWNTITGKRLKKHYVEWK